MPIDTPRSALPPTGSPPAVTAAVERLLIPLLRVMIHFGVTFPMLGSLLKRAYVEAATRHFALADKELSDSRVALLTGLHRKDISVLRHRPEETPTGRPGTLSAQVISRWIGHPDWRDDEGRPLALPRTSEAGRSFEALVSGISRDIRSRTLLDELLRIGLVRERADGLLELLDAADVPSGDLDRMAYYFGRNLADHLSAAGHNLIGEAPPHMERALAFDGLSEAAVAQLTAEAGRLGMEVLTRLNAMAVTLADADPPLPEASRRFVAGLYVFSAPDEAPPPAPEGQ
jgi:hypothetical protein